ncbi:TCP-1/cpn60 chaperonin family protein [Haladaptatus halobius]|uniref:TCP-1/cpn60 chaperonin family protein n=1 Tax=Haladaptatus halobius TaxID=2884875 RepID=UPI001D0B7E60|nr:TCP-1/cpn60 chaperonin family protein [Haladaptatus halobius]
MRNESVPEFPEANIVAIDAIAEIMRSSLGPTPQDTLILTQLETRSGDAERGIPGTDEFVVTNDGATILEELPLEHPIAPVLLRVIGPERPGDTAVEGERIPDGVTTTVVLAAALLDEASSLLETGLHPATIVSGYEIALDTAIETFNKTTRDLQSFANSAEAARNVAQTAMTGNDVGQFSDEWSQLAVEAVETVGMPDEITFVVRQISKGRIADSALVRGAVLDRHGRAHPEMPRRKRDANILVLGGQENRGLQIREPESISGVRVDSIELTAAIHDSEQTRRHEVVEYLTEMGVDVVITQSGIDPHYLRLLADAGILGIRGVTSLDFPHVNQATGATPVVKPDDATTEDLGYAGLVEEQQIEPRRHRRKNRHIIVFDECRDPTSVTAVLRGVSGSLSEQMTRQVRKAAAAVGAAQGCKHYVPGVVPGGGATELHVARTLESTAISVGEREQLAISGFASAVESVLATLIRNAGRDPIATLATLRAKYENGDQEFGLILPEGEVGNVVDAGLLDPVAYRRQQYICATEIAQLILKVDDAIDAEFQDDSD